MATQATYYLDTPSLASASAIYTNSGLTIIAPNGFYSDSAIVREQVNGVLLPQTSCPACATPCGGVISASGSEGVYYLNTELGSGLGAIIISFDPYSVPDGIQATFDGVVYNGLSSPYFGWLEGGLDLPTYIGSTSANCGLPAGSPFSLPIYNYVGNSFVAAGGNESVSIVSGQLDLTDGDPGTCIMVIPKTESAPSVLSLKMVGPCPGTAFEVSVLCPAALGDFSSSVMFASSALACLSPIAQTYYVAHVTGSAGVLGLYDLVFSDANGQTKLASGFYRTSDAGVNTWFQVDAHGVIVAFGVCAAGGTTFDVGFGATANEACAAISMIEVVGDDASFCMCTQFESAAFSEYATGIYYISYGSNSIAIAITSGSDIAIVEGVCTVCSGVVQVTGVSGSMEPCIGGTIDDHMGAQVSINTPMGVDVNFLVQVSFVYPGNNCAVENNTQSISVDIFAGKTVSSFNACTSGYYISGGADICSACILTCDNPSVNITSFTC